MSLFWLIIPWEHPLETRKSDNRQSFGDNYTYHQNFYHRKMSIITNARIRAKCITFITNIGDVYLVDVTNCWFFELKWPYDHHWWHNWRCSILWWPIEQSSPIIVIITTNGTQCCGVFLPILYVICKYVNIISCVFYFNHST